MTSFRYRLGDVSSEWRGKSTDEVQLPLKLRQGESESLTIDDAQAEAGGWLARPIQMELFVPPALQLEAFWPEDGAANVSPNADPTFRFNEPITDRASAENAIFFDPPPPGHFEWLAPNRVHFITDESFAHESAISWYIRGGLEGPRGASGSFLAAPAAGIFSTAKLKAAYESSPAFWISRVRISRRRAASKTKRWKDTLGGSGGSKICMKNCYLAKV